MFRLSSGFFFLTCAYLFLKRFYLDELIRLAWWIVDSMLRLFYGLFPDSKTYYEEQLACAVDKPYSAEHWADCRSSPLDFHAYVYAT